MRAGTTAGVTTESWPWRRALAWLAFLAPFFFITYGLANWSAAQRVDVPTIRFDWETSIPFWPWTILPYWSIDLLYGLSLFVCLTRSELDTHAKRLLTAQVVAVTCFVFMPLRFSPAHPAADGVWGFMFDVLAGFDQPFNQLPSLHIALTVILWALYARRLTGATRVAMGVWFLLIGGSVLTTYQHHFIDVPTGLLLGALCLWTWPFADEGNGLSIASQWQWTRERKRWWLAAGYVAGATAVATIAIVASGWWLWLLWCSVSFVLVAAAYAAIGAPAFQKRDNGRLNGGARWLFAPYRALAWINSRLWTWREPHPMAVADGVFLGRMPTSRELVLSPFVGVIDMTAELAIRFDRDCTHLAIPVLDLTTPPPAALAQAAGAIDAMRAHGPVLVCCALGYSRSACAVAAWLLASGRAADVDAALAIVRRARAKVSFDHRHTAALNGIVEARARQHTTIATSGAQ
ncbi:MAG: phosphatase PAP2/dual specificity phosphatase family protein [Betaproteobacteria bacterium]